MRKHEHYKSESRLATRDEAIEREIEPDESEISPDDDERIATKDEGEVAAAELLSTALRKKFELIRNLDQRADRWEIELRFEIAEHCRDVKDGDGNKFGDGAVQKLADALGWAASTIYDYASVARAWKSKAEAVDAAQAMNGGWRHLVEIASAPKKSSRSCSPPYGTRA